MSLLGSYSLRQISMAILIGGLTAGTLDVFVAAAINGLPPGTILQAIASGLFGKAAFFGGGKMMATGLALQWVMSLIIAKIYVLAGVRLPILFRRPVTMGALYGVGVFIVMNLIVVPLSAAWPKNRHHSVESIVLNLAAMVLFGLIIALTPWLMKMKPAGPVAA
jgi:uncharacterized membrane protein YagU involved in acid resistance